MTPLRQWDVGGDPGATSAHGVVEEEEPGGGDGQSVFPDAPEFDSENEDHALHAEELWGGYTDVDQVGTANRVDGGGPWTNDGVGFQTFAPGDPDPFFGASRSLVIDYQDAPAEGQSLGRGLVLTQDGPNPRYLNVGDEGDQLIIQYAWRYSGTAPYEGKICDFSPFAGTDRFNYQAPSDAAMGAQIDNNCDDDTLGLCQLHFANAGQTPLFAGLPPTFRTPGAEVARAIFGDVVFYTQNRNYGTGAGQISWGDGNGNLMLGGPWRLTTIALTKNVGGVMGRGRIESWVHKFGEASAVKEMEYIGDVGGAHAGKVRGRDESQSGSAWLHASVDLHWYSLTSVAGIFNGGCTLHLGGFRVWSRSRLALP